jgi:hypothetical protein
MKDSFTPPVTLLPWKGQESPELKDTTFFKIWSFGGAIPRNRIPPLEYFNVAVYKIDSFSGLAVRVSGYRSRDLVFDSRRYQISFQK